MKSSLNNHGFTLVEAVVSMLILGIGMLGITTMIMSASQIQRDAYQLTDDSSKSQTSIILGDYTSRTAEDGSSQSKIKVNFDDITIQLEGEYRDSDKYSYFYTKEANKE